MTHFAHSGRLQVEQSLNLNTTLESGQTFLWNREGQDMFEENHSEDQVYTTARLRESGEVMVIRIIQAEGNLVWKSTHPDAPEYLTKVFRLDEDYDYIRQSVSERDSKGVIEDAMIAYPGLRVVNEPLFPTLISFICSSAARVPLTHKRVQELSEVYGPSVDISGRKYNAFPTAQQLASTTEDDLEDRTSVGYRAEYILKTSKAIVTKSPALEPLPAILSEARTHLQRYPGVGPKVADCVLLYGGEYNSVVPVDTQIEQAIKQYYPSLAKLSKKEMAFKFEDFFGEYAGYAQMYLYHYQRSNTNG